MEVEQGARATASVGAAMKEVSEIARDIVDATGEQAAGSRRVADAIEHVNELTQNATAGAEEMSSATTALSDLSHTPYRIVELFRLQEETGVVPKPGSVPAVVGRQART